MPCHNTSKGENKMKVFLTGDGKQKSKLQYSKQDITDLSILSSAITSLTQAMIVFHKYKDSTEVDPEYNEMNIYTILDLLIKPINDFFLEGAPTEKKAA